VLILLIGGGVDNSKIYLVGRDSKLEIVMVISEAQQAMQTAFLLGSFWQAVLGLIWRISAALGRYS
jgi:hypothetical protein